MNRHLICGLVLLWSTVSSLGSAQAVPFVGTALLLEGPTTLALTRSPSGQVSLLGFTNSAGTITALHPADLFELRLHDGRSDWTATTSDFSECTIDSSVPNRLVLQFNGLSVTKGTAAVEVIIEVKGGAFEFRIAVQNELPMSSLREVAFPRMGVQALNGSPLFDRVAVPVFGGMMYEDQSRLEWERMPWPGMPYQMVFFNDPSERELLICRTLDGEGHLKAFDLNGYGTGSLLEVIQFPIDVVTPSNDYVSPYATSIQPLHGSWYDAASIYRDWAENQWWVRGLSDPAHAARRDQPLRDLKLHVLMYTDHLMPFDDFHTMMSELVELRDALGLESGEMATLIGDWSNNLFDQGWPTEIPAQRSFRRALALAHDEEIHVIPYVNFSRFALNSPAYFNFSVADVATYLPDGSLATTSVFGLDLVSLNPAFPATADITSELAYDIMHHLMGRASGLYLDTFTGRLSKPNYHPSNTSIPTGGGTAYAHNRVLEARKIRNALKGFGSEKFVTSEWVDETVLGVIDMTFAHVEPIRDYPIFDTIYNQCSVRSTLSGTTPRPTAPVAQGHKRQLSVNFHSGKILGITNYFAHNTPWLESPLETSPLGLDHGGMLGYLKELLDADTEALRAYRLSGRRLRPLAVSLESALDSLDFATIAFGDALTSVWRRPDGRVGIVATNTSPSPHAFTLDITLSDYDLSGRFDVVVHQSGVASTLLSVNSGTTPRLGLPLLLPVDSVALIEFVPRAATANKR